MGANNDTDLALKIRYFVYEQIVEKTTPPSVRQTANQFGLTEAQVATQYKWLHDNHFFFLEPNTTTIRMANPFSAVPTHFKVTVEQKMYWANCAWDMLGIPAALGRDATIEATYTDTQEIAQIAIESGRLHHSHEVVHFPLPVQRWYDDLILT